MTPLVSIITPVFNAEKTLRATVESVQVQTFQDWEHILINDSSQDGSWELMESLAAGDDRVHVINMAENGGAAKARNMGISAANGRYIAFIDSDDLWAPMKLERQLGFMKERQATLSHTSYEFINEAGETMNKMVHAKPKLNYKQMLNSNYIGCLTAMYDAEKLGKVLMPDIRKRQDYALWLKIMRSGQVAYGLDECLAYYRVGEASLSSNKWKAAQYNYKLLTEIEGISPPRAIMHLMKYVLNGVLKHYT